MGSCWLYRSPFPMRFVWVFAHVEGSPVDISIDGERLIIQPVQSTKYVLKDLVSEIREDNLHEEIQTGDSVGREAW